MNSAALSVLSEAGYHGHDAESAWRHILSELASPSPRSRERLAALGLDTDAVDTAIHRNVSIFRRLADAGLDSDGAQTMFGAAAGAAMALVEQIERFESLESA